MLRDRLVRFYSWLFTAWFVSEGLNRMIGREHSFLAFCRFVCEAAKRVSGHEPLHLSASPRSASSCAMSQAEKAILAGVGGGAGCGPLAWPGSAVEQPPH